MGSPIDRTAKTAMDLNLVNGVTSDAPKLKASDNVLYDYVDGLNSAQDAHAQASTLAHPDGSVKTAKIADGAVTTQKLADLSVTTPKIALGAVGADQLATSGQVNESVNNVLINALKADVAQRAINVMSAPYNAKGDGVTDDTASIQAAVTAGAGKTVYFPPGTYYVTNKITVPNSNKGTKLVSGAGSRAGDGLIHIDSTFPANTPVFELADGTIVENITISNNSATKVGTGFSFKTNGKWCSLNDVAVIGLDKGFVYPSGCYYNVLRKPIVQQCNIALEIDAGGGNCGGLLVEGGQFSNNVDKGLFMKSGGNDIKLHGVVMEYNVNNHVNSISGTVSLQKCYLADGSITPIYVNGGKVVIDGDDTEIVGGGGAYLTPNVGIPTYGIKADTGEVILKNLTLSRNIYANIGTITGTYYPGFDLYSSNAKVTTDNVKATDYRQVRLDKNINNNLERIDNYVINGEFSDLKHLLFDWTIAGTSSTIDIATENGYGGRVLKITNWTGMCQITGKFYAPNLVGELAYIGIEIADNSQQNAPRFNATNTTPITDGSLPKLSDANYFLNSQFPGWQVPGGISGYPMCHWFPCIVNKSYGDIKYYLYFNGLNANLTIHRMFMVDADNFTKVATLRSSTDLPRYGTAIPTVGTWDASDRVINSAPTVGQPKSWVCTVSGTFGTLNGAATTGSITTGTAILTVNSATGMLVGQYINIVGVAGSKMITAISGTTITIDSNANATVSGAAVSYTTPTLVSEGNL